MKKFLLVLTFVLMTPSVIFASELDEEVLYGIGEPGEEVLYGAGDLEEEVLYGAGEWDVLLDDHFFALTTGIKTPTVTSGGGDLQVCIGGVEPGNLVNFSLVKSTGQIITYLFADNTSGTTESEYKCLPKIDVRPYVNSNGKFDLYLTAKGTYSDAIRITIKD